MEDTMLGTTAWRSQKVNGLLLEFSRKKKKKKKKKIVLGLHASLGLLMDGFDSGLLGVVGQPPPHGVASEPPLTTDFYFYF
jgi:hypothetical protein